MKKSTAIGTLCMLVMGIPAPAQHLAAVTEGTAADIASLQPVLKYSLPWSTIKMEDIKWIKRVWREINVNDEGNRILITNSGKPTGLFETLAAGAINGTYAMYDAGDDGFTTEIPVAERKNVIDAGKKSSIHKYKIKEDWLCLKNDGHIEVRILGVAPVVVQKNTNGEIEEETLCWFYYPDARPQLASGLLPNTGKNQPSNWDEIFQYRRFIAPIKKVTHRE